ncbi:TPA: hypothetical protein HA241_06105 [Candidatus Woesearchaeota archaeon]|nr:hypothetical protein [Candidatus Woesearchaeota archaeon]
MKTLQWSIFTIIVVTVLLFSISTYFNQLDQQYFQEHQQELTTTETIINPDGETTNYFYADTPYTITYKLFLWAYLFIPFILVITLGIRYILSHPPHYFQSLIIPVSFVVLTFILQAKNIYAAVGWEKSFGIILVSLYCGIVLSLVAIINLIIASQKRK